MKLYDEIIKKWGRLINACPTLSMNVDSNLNNYDKWTDIGSHQMILRSDMAYELGGSTPSLYAIGSTVVTEDTKLFNSITGPKSQDNIDELILIGQDLNEISDDISYARLAIVLVNADSEMGALRSEGNKLYNAIKKVDYTRYHVNPEGFMMRVSSVYGRESVRISKSALKKGLSFEKVGNLMLSEFHKNKEIEAVKLLFITDPNFDFKALNETAKDALDITTAIDHIMKNAMTDCSSCSLQKVCDEVEDLRKLHFKGQA